MNKLAIVTGSVGAVVLVVACVLGFRVLPDYITNKIEEEVSLIPQSDTWNKWQEITRPIYLNVYAFNLTNPEEFDNGAYPQYEELGPYAYKQIRRKINLSQPDGERSVVYEQQTHYIFDEERSNANGRNYSESDLINIVNLPFLSIINAINKATDPATAGNIANVIIPNEKVVRSGVTVGDLVFHGIDVSLYVALLTLIEQPIPEEFEGGRFALYKGRNGSSDGIYKIHTGVGDSSNFGKIITWNGKSDLGLWQPLSQCDKVNGTDGSIFPPFVKKERIVEIFSSDVCRSLYLTFQKEVEIKGIKGYRFTLPEVALEDPKINQQNRCFCNEEDTNNCMGSGVIDISTCRNGAPVVLSTPYFLGGEANYSVASGLWPTQSFHETIIDVEPNSGVLLGANKRIQINVNHKIIPTVNAMVGRKEMILPLIWIDESAELPDDSAQEIKDTLLSPKSKVETWRWVGVGLGIAIILAGVGLYVWKG